MRLCFVLVFAVFLTSALECADAGSDHEAGSVLLARLKGERKEKVLPHRGERRRKAKQIKRAKRKKSKNSKKRKGKDELLHPKGLSNCECGTHNLAGNRVVNGVEAQPNSYPWMALLLMKKYRDKEDVAFCGGNVISTAYVLTAAHCCIGLKPKELLVRLGDHHYRADDIPRAYDAGVREIIMHEEYDDYTLDNDICLLELDVTIEFYRDRSVGPVCLPSPSKNYNNKDVIATGWGILKNKDSKMSPVLMEVQSTLVSSKRCQKDFPFYEDDITENMICMDIETGSICSGDSGGPMVHRDLATDRFAVVGLSSWLYNKCNNKVFPAVFVKVVNYLSWIFKNTKNSKYCQPLGIPEKP